MSLRDRFIQYIKKENLFPAGDTLLLAVSGGVDSIVLCELCHQGEYRFAIAHCNFRLRKNESERDKEFVSNLAKRYGVEFYLKEFETDTYATDNKISIQGAARKLRYEWFHALTHQLHPKTNSPIANWIVTAHHADDNIETMLMNFFRGTGIQGIRGIIPKQGQLVRPLLQFRKEELLQFAKEHTLNWVEDSSNLSDKYSRNYFRNNVIPTILNIYPEAEQNLLNNLQRFQDIEILYRQSVEMHKAKLAEKRENELHISVLKLKKAKPLVTIIHEIIKDYNFTSAQINDVIKLMESETGKFVQSPTHWIIKNRNWLILASKSPGNALNIIIEETDSIIPFELGELSLEKIQTTNTPGIASYKLQTANHIAQLNAKEIQFPLLLRKWKMGDYFYPLGMKKKKKLSRFFIDQKLSKSDKENVWVLEMNKKIIWVPGMRIDERFKIHESDSTILLITLKRK